MSVEMLIASQLSLSIDPLPWLPLGHMIQLDNAFTFLNVNALSNYLIALLSLSNCIICKIHVSSTYRYRYEISLTNRVRGL